MVLEVDRDRQLEHIQHMSAQLKKYEELKEKLTKTHALEETCSSQQDQIKSLHYQLIVANQKLKKGDLVTIEIMQKNEARNKLVDDLQSRVTYLECQLVEGEKLRKKLHNTILAINKSLSSLSDVILAIAKKDDLVPYGNSKLMHLLQPCLGGDSKTFIFVNLSPEASSAGESFCSLRFAAHVNSCEIGAPRATDKRGHWIPD